MTRLDNEKKIEEWETGLRTNEAMADRREHDITQQIARQAKNPYKELAMQLASNRTLTDEQRHTIWGRQDACLFILSMTEVDAKGRLKQIEQEIRQALSASI